jgi:Domain of unknown function (DUF222)
MFDTLESPPSWVDDYFESLDVDAEATSLSADAALDEIVACERIVASAQARQIRALARFAELRPDRLGGVTDEFTADEVAPLLHISRNAAQSRLKLATQLTSRLQRTLTALDCGDLDLHKAHIIAELTAVLGDEQAAAVEARILPRAAEKTPGQLRAAVRRAVLRIDPHGAEERRQKRIRARAVVLKPGEDGTADLTATHLDAADATAAYQRLDDYARAMTSDDGRTMDQRRADALVDLLLGRSLPTCSDTAAQVQVTIAASTLLGLDDQPGELAGYGPITAEAARALAADGIWRRIVTDPLSGTVLDVGRTTYRPPAALADHVRTRDKTCRFPGCRQPAGRCDLDHSIPYPEGPTSASNMNCLCRHHHRLKHERNWSMDQDPDGTITWISPTRRRYVTRVGDE